DLTVQEDRDNPQPGYLTDAQSLLEQTKLYLKEKTIEVDNYEDIPRYVRYEVEVALRDDILERYDNSSYHNEDIIHNTLLDYGFKIKD
ncbi:MAG: hypothetical protein R6V58_01795, partial [Planctomycetota bacterium]